MSSKLKLDPQKIKAKIKPDIKECNNMKTTIAGFKIYDSVMGMDYPVPPVNKYIESVKRENLVLMIFTKDVDEGIQAKSYFRLMRDMKIDKGCNISFLTEYNGRKTLLGYFLKYFGLEDIESLDDFQYLIGKECYTIVKKSKNRELLQIYYAKD